MQIDTTRADAAGEECLKSLIPGKRILLWYSDDTVWHEAMIGLVVSDRMAVIYTPDDDLYMEDLTYGSRHGPAKVKSLNPNLSLPRNLRARAYRFRARLTDDVVKGIIKRSLAMAEQQGYSPTRPSKAVDATGVERPFDEFIGDGVQVAEARHGADAGGGTPKSARVVRAAVGDSVWVAAEPLGGLTLGQEVSLNEETDVQCGDRCALAYRQGEYVKVEMIRVSEAVDYASRRRALFRAAGRNEPGDVQEPDKEEEGSGSDVRTLWVDYDEHGERFKRWRDVVKESHAPSFEEKPLEGPATALHLIKHSERHGGDPRLWLQLWARAKHIEQSDRVHHELKVLTDCLFFAGTFDQLNIPALVSLEVVCRRIQAIVDAYSHPTKPSWENAKIFTGMGSPEDIVSPTFRTYAAKKNKDELELLQARQKVRELRVGHGGDDADVGDALPSRTPKGPKAKAKGAGKGGGGQGEA